MSESQIDTSGIINTHVRVTELQITALVLELLYYNLQHLCQHYCTTNYNTHVPELLHYKLWLMSELLS